MAPVTHQTVRLGRGKHASPAEGACVMELASMLAGEPFSDHPISVCPVIGSFLRAYNDSIDDEHRQDLYPYAAKVVGSRASEEVRERRTQRLAEWTASMKRRRARRSRLFRMPSWAVFGPAASPGQVGVLAVHAIPKHDPRVHGEVLAVIDELLKVRPPAPVPPPRSTRRARAERSLVV